MGRDEEQGAEKDDEGACSPGPLTGGYYWLPAPGHPTICWDVVTCHQLGFDAEVGHVEMWTAVTDRLASAWHKDAAVLRRLLKDCCYAFTFANIVTNFCRVVFAFPKHSSRVNDREVYLKGPGIRFRGTKKNHLTEIQMHVKDGGALQVEAG